MPRCLGIVCAEACGAILNETYFNDGIKAVDAKFEAQKLAFAPVAFQAARSLRDLGILEALSAGGDKGMTILDLAAKLSLQEYALKVLLEFGLSLGLVKLRRDSGETMTFVLGKIGHFFQFDTMTKVNADFVNDVCYAGLFDLEGSLRSGKPTGLRVFGEWNTIYEGLASLPSGVRESWFAFDHFYSDCAFPDALPLVFARKPKSLMDIGGNTAKWALSCLRFDPDVRVTIVDLPGQLADAARNVEAAGFTSRVDLVASNMLDRSQGLPAGADAVWMSQFLDCFSLPEVGMIMGKIAAAVDSDCDVFVLEPFWDKQAYPAASYSLHATSLYFTNMANGNSKMYESGELIREIEAAGFRLEEATHRLGANDYSLMRFRKTLRQ